MADVVTTHHKDGVALIALNNPPVNAAGLALRQGLSDAVARAEADPTIAAIGLYGEGRSFIAGADIREFGEPPVAPWLPDLCNQLECCTTPIVSVLHGAALGGGLEVALATHARIAVPGVQLGFPEVTLGILPGAGGTQRAPRVAGIVSALDLIVTGRRIGADEALRLGLVDRVRDGAPRDIAFAACLEIMAGALPIRVTGTLQVTPDEAALADTRADLEKRAAHLFAPHRCVDAVAASTGPLDAGLAEERRLFDACMHSPQRAGLIHAFFAERAVAHIPERGASARDVASVGVIGAGTMGSGIATACALAGLPVTLVDQAPDVLAQGAARVGAALDGAVERGKMTAEARTSVVLGTEMDLAALASCDLIIEAVFEDMDLKQDIFAALGRIAKPGAVLATNTSYLDVDAIARASGRASDVVGLHFFSPAHVMRLLEVAVGAATPPDVVATGFAVAKRLKKVAVRAGICDGFIGNRIMSRFRQAADRMLLEGTPVDVIDAAIRDFGFAMGPFEVSDLAGLDIGWANRKRLAAARPSDEVYLGGVADALCERGDLGRKTGRGYYDYSGARPVPTSDLGAMAMAERIRLGLTERRLGDDDIVARYLTAMVMEAARVLEDGIALRPVDIDAVLLFGYGFPRWRGGPLHHADTLGVDQVLADLERFAQDDPAFWRAPDSLARMTRDGTCFADLNERD